MGCFLWLLAFVFHSLSLLTLASGRNHGHCNGHATTPCPQDWVIKDLFSGNQYFIHNVNVEYPGLLEQTAQSQQPPFMYIGCADSRVSEGTIFDAPPGTLFSLRNIGNQYSANDTAGVSAVAYGVNRLNVTHIIVTGHYGCGGVAAAISGPSPDLGQSVAQWVQPIRNLYATSERPEIVELRRANSDKPNIPSLANDNPGYRALVEENVKLNVAELVADLSKSPSNRAKPLQVHGFVYGEQFLTPPKRINVTGIVIDIATGGIKDLNVTVTVVFGHKN